MSVTFVITLPVLVPLKTFIEPVIIAEPEITILLPEITKLTEAVAAVPVAFVNKNLPVAGLLILITPDVPLLPDDPLLPEEPDVPDDPLLPEEPDVPDVPLEPFVPLVPELPFEPDVPDVPEEPINVSFVTL